MSGGRMLAIVNPYGGRGRGQAVLEELQSILAGRDIAMDAVATTQAGDARRVARESDFEDYAGLCVAGGDGTIHEVVSGLHDRGEPVTIPLAIVPVGTGNDVAQQLGFSGPAAAAEMIVDGSTRSFDVLEVRSQDQTHHCATLVGWAGVADINRRAERLRSFGVSRYSLAAVKQIAFPTRRRGTLLLDDVSIEDEFQVVIACNTVFAGAGMQIAPRAKVDDGLMDVVVVRNATRLQLLQLFQRVQRGAHLNMACVEYFQVRTMEIRSDDREPLDLDGEIKAEPPVSLNVLPGALSFFGASDN